MRRLKPRPIVTGILVDSVGSLVLAILYFVVIFGIQIVRGASIADQALALSGSQLVVTEVLGLLLTAVGGFVAAHLAKIMYVHHGIAVGIGPLLLGLLLEWLSPSEGVSM